MLHRYEDVIINPLIMDTDFALSKLLLLRQYGFSSEELIRDPLNFYLKHGNNIPINVDSVTLNNLVATLDSFTSSSLLARWTESYNVVHNKIPLTNFANTFYELWATIINHYRLAITGYINKLNHILLCEGIITPNIFIQNVLSVDGTDALINSGYVILRVYITNGE